MILAELFPYAHVVYNALMVVYVITIVGTIAVVIGENRNPVKSLAWVTVLLLLPALGLILYLFFGRSLKSIHIISRKDQHRLQTITNPHPFSIEADKVAGASTHLCGKSDRDFHFRQREI